MNFLKGGVYMSEALSSAVSILNSAWGFISGNEVLFGICAVGLLTAAIFKVKRMF